MTADDLPRGLLDGQIGAQSGVCDTHLHFYDQRYPPTAEAVLFPPDASPQDYRRVQATLGSDRLVVVQPTTYGMDNRCQLEAMATFGDAARGVMVVDSKTPDSDLAAMTDAGVLGARFHMLPGGAVPWEELEPTAARIASYGWHVQLQLDGNTLPDHLDRLLALPVDLVIDHIGRFMPPPSPDAPAFAALLRLIEHGRTWVKLSAPYEATGSTEDQAYTEVLPLVDALVGTAPERLLWASNWPHPGQGSPPTEANLITLVTRWLPSVELQRQVLVTNPTELYRFS